MQPGSPRWWKGVLPLTLVALVAGFSFPLAAQDIEPIVKIEVVGAQKQTAETVIFKSGVHVGDDLRNVDLSSVMEQALGQRRLRRHQARAGGCPGRQEAGHPHQGAAPHQGDRLPRRHRGGHHQHQGQGEGEEAHHQPGHGLRSRGGPEDQGPDRGSGGREGLPQPRGGHHARAHGPRRGPAGLRGQGRRQGQDLQGRVPGQQGVLQRPAAQRHEEDAQPLDVQLAHHPRPAGGQEPGRGPGEPQEGLLEAGLQGCLRGQAGHRGRGPHHGQAEEEEREARQGGEVPQVRPPRHPHHPHPRGRAVLRRHLQGRGRQALPREPTTR